MIRRFIAPSVIALCVVAPNLAQERSTELVIEGGTLVDGTGAAPRRDVRVVIEDGWIRGITAAGTTPAPAGAKVIAANGKYIVPGLIDGHAHWRGWTGPLFLAHGVTAIIDLGNPSDWIIAAKGAEEAGRLRGAPRLFIAGEVLDRAGTTDVCSSSGLAPVGQRVHVTGAAGARRAARALIGKGADLLKVDATLTGEELAAIATEAHDVDLAVVGHTRDLRDAVERGLDGIVHLLDVARALKSPADREALDAGRLACPYARMDTAAMDDLVALLVRKGTSISPALLAEHGASVPAARSYAHQTYDLLMQPGLRHVPRDTFLSSLTLFHRMRSYSSASEPYPYVALSAAAEVQDCREGFARVQNFLRRFAAAGGRIFAGTDTAAAPTVPGLSLHHELELLVEAGLSPMQALQAATKHPADLFGKSYKLGTIEVGKAADLVLVDADPLADIRNLRKIHMVVKDGAIADITYRADYAPELSELEHVGVNAATAPTPRISGILTKTMNTWSMVINNGSPFDVVVNGSGFDRTSIVHLSGRPLATRFVSPRELHARVPTQRIPVPGTFPVTVVTPWPGGGTSNAVALVVK
jgi:cytosine/adenosine deaminase-related metal-dependent hydrolase